MAEPFSNEPIPVDRLPRLSDDAFVPVDPRYLRASLTGFAAVALVVIVIAAFWVSQASDVVVPLVVCGGILGVVATSATLRSMEVRRLGYQVREHDLSLRSGVITHSIESLPFSRVQHVNVHRGPIERALGLATLEVSSAGPDITIPGLAHDDAARIKRLVSERAGVDDGGERALGTAHVPLPPPSSRPLPPPSAPPSTPPSTPPSPPPPTTLPPA